ncbi:MAG: TonB-dependent receptor plug domain-containing protein, partial [Vicinamibacterales bacterium]
MDGLIQRDDLPSGDARVRETLLGDSSYDADPAVPGCLFAAFIPRVLATFVGPDASCAADRNHGGQSARHGRDPAALCLTQCRLHRRPRAHRYQQSHRQRYRGYRRGDRAPPTSNRKRRVAGNAGLSVHQSGGPGTQTSVFIRGANSNHTLVLLDGMRLSDPSTPNGAVDFAHLLTDNLERIEVVRGPMSTLYGSDALGGVINMMTKAGKGPLNATAFAEIGTRGQTTVGTYLRGSEGRFNYNVSLGGVYTPGETIVPARFTPAGGYVDNDSYRNVTFGSRLGFELNDNAQFTWFSRYIDTQIKYDQVGAEDPNAIGFTQQLFNRLQFDGSFFNDRWIP